MENRIQLINYKGQEIIYINYGGFTVHTKDEFIKTIETAAEFMISRGENQLTLTDVRNTFGDSETVAKLKEISSKTKFYRKKAAVVGVTGVKSVLLKAINLFSKSEVVPFDTIEEAKEWLVN
jgi:hypothetical protein